MQCNANRGGQNRDSAKSFFDVKFPTLNFYNILYILAITLFIFAIFARIYQYIFHKDLWLDEAMLAFSMFGVDFKSLFFAPLPNTQSVPLLFLVLSKIIGSAVDYSEYGLYCLPFICGILNVILCFKIAKILFGNGIGFIVFIVLVCGSLGLLHYTTEFKQYGIEAFCGILLFYLYLKNVDVKIFIAVSVICMLASHTGIFVAFAILLGYLKIFPLQSFVKNNRLLLVLGIILGTLFLLYYVLYVRFQAVSNFYDYWSEWLIPLDLASIPSFLLKILPVWSGFTPFDKGYVIPIYMIISLFGLWSLWHKNRNIFVILMGAFGIYVLLSLAQLYPFGHNGIIGGRLSLFMSIFFYVPCAFGAEFLYDTFSKKWWRVFIMICLLLLIMLSFYRNVAVIVKSRHHIQQTHSFITQISKESAESSGCIFVYEATKHAFLYYSYIDKLNLPFYVFGRDLDEFKNHLESLHCDKTWILASHYPQGFADDLMAKLSDKNIKVEYAKTGWETILGRF